MLHVAERRAAEFFRVQRELNHGDPELAASFDEILRDEKYHVAYTQRFLERWRAEGRGRVLARAVATFPRAPRAFARSAFAWLGDRLWVRSRIAEELGLPAARVHFVDQARAHMAGAFHASPFERAALLHLDDVGEWSTSALGRGDERGIELVAELRHPHSLGGLASAFTQFVGFTPGEDERLLEDLAACGEVRFASELARLCPARGAFFELDESCFDLEEGAERLYTPRL
jgi:carbamoyltransferase